MLTVANFQKVNLEYNIFLLWIWAHWKKSKYVENELVVFEIDPCIIKESVRIRDRGERGDRSRNGGGSPMGSVQTNVF